jgi:hypothetical protein
MRMSADLKCYACGFVSGQIEGDDKEPIQRGKLKSHSPLGVPKRRQDGRLACLRCGGALYLDDVTYERPAVTSLIGQPAASPVRLRTVAKAS